MTSGVRLNVLGGFDLRVDGQEGPPLPRKTRALLTVLAMDRGRPVGREWLGELLWPGSGPRQVSGSLREALYQLRRPLRDRGVVVAHDGCLALGDGVATDLEEFNRHIASSNLASLRSAAEAYAGPLLAGFPPLEDDFDAWLSASRAQLEDRALAIMARIGDLSTAAGDAAGAMAAAERMFAIDPLREDVHWRLLESCAAAGRRADALRHYATIVEALKRGLDTVPGARTRAIVQRLRGEMDPAAAAPLPHPQPTPRGSPPSIAVLPFTQLGDEAVPSHLADGILVDTVCQLAGLREVQVISHGSTLAYRDPGIDLRQAGRELGARYVVRGAMRRRGNALRLTTELADAATGAVVWARTHDTTATLDFADQDRLVAQIVNTLAPRVGEQELRRVRGQRPETLSTYDKVLLARACMLERTRESYDKAKSLIDEATRLEPSYSEAHALAADWHGFSIAEGFAVDRDLAVSELLRLVTHALSLDAGNVRALTYGAHWKALMHRDYGGAQEMFGRALELVPHYAPAWLWSSYTWAYAGSGQEAVRRAARALELSPVDRHAHDFYSALCVSHYAAGEHDAAANWGLRALASPPVLLATYRWTAVALVAAGRQRDASNVVRAALPLMPQYRVGRSIRHSPFADDAQRAAYGRHLLAAGFPA